MKFLVYLFVPYILFSCSAFKSKPVQIKDINLKLTAIKGWTRIPNESVDYSFYNDQSKSYILASSQCEKYKNSSNKHLLYTMLGDIKYSITSSKSISLFDREGSQSIIEANVDGINTNLSTIFLKKNHCSYDFILINSNKSFFFKDLADFEKIIAGASL